MNKIVKSFFKPYRHLTLPLKMCKGSASSRSKQALEMTEDFFQRISGQFHNGEIPSKVIQKELKNTIPIKTRIKVKQNLRDGEVASLVCDPIPILGGYTMNLPMDFVTKKVKIKNTNPIMHESYHLFEYLCTPKYIKRDDAFSNIKGIYSNHEYFLDDKLYAHNSNLKKLKQELSDHLNGRTAEDKINILQFYRYELKSEYNAHKVGQKYEKEIDKIYHRPNFQDQYVSPWNSYNFKPKIKLLEKTLAEVIASARKEHAEKLAGNISVL